MEFKEHYKIKLHKKAKVKTWENYLKQQGIFFEKKEYFPGYEIYKIEKPGEQEFSLLSKREEVARIEIMHRYFLNFQTKTMEAESFGIPSPEKEKDYPLVGILDNGVGRIPEFTPWLYEDGKEYCFEEKHPTHGSFVAGVILYGEQWNSKKWILGNMLKIYDAAIVPDFSIYQLEEDELLARLRKVVEEHSFIKVWNLAISIRFEVDLAHISDFGLLLDYLQEKYDILICKSCGNGNFVAEKEKRGKILQGSDTIRSLVVASCNEQGELSSFSLSGQGHEILEKPDVAMYGGDVSWTEKGKKKIEAVYSLSPDGEVVSSFGTSFATARVTSLAGNILYWKPNATALFLKAMIVHTASKGEKYFLGYGCPKNTLEIQKEYQASITIEDELVEEKRILLPYHNGVISCTFVSEVLVDYHQEEDYVLCDIEVQFEKNGEKLKNKNIYGDYKKLNNLKKYQFFMKEEKGEVEVVFYKRWKKKEYFSKERDRNLRYCLIWKF